MSQETIKNTEPFKLPGSHSPFISKFAEMCRLLINKHEKIHVRYRVAFFDTFVKPRTTYLCAVWNLPQKTPKKGGRDSQETTSSHALDIWHRKKSEVGDSANILTNTDVSRITHSRYVLEFTSKQQVKLFWAYTKLSVVCWAWPIIENSEGKSTSTRSCTHASGARVHDPVIVSIETSNTNEWMFDIYFTQFQTNYSP